MGTNFETATGAGFFFLKRDSSTVAVLVRGKEMLVSSREEVQNSEAVLTVVWGPTILRPCGVHVILSLILPFHPQQQLNYSQFVRGQFKAWFSKQCRGAVQGV